FSRRRTAMRPMPRPIAGLVSLLALLGVTSVLAAPAASRELLLAEPVHHIGFLPIYVALHQGYFNDEGIDLKITVMVTPGFVNAVVTGDAFAFTGSVDHNAFAKANGKDLKAVSNLDGR